MKPYFIKSTPFIKSIFKNWVWDLPAFENTMYLTFDDGPTPDITDWTLDMLERYRAKATFFCIGKNIVEHPEIYSKIIQKGHAIGNHTQNHLNGWKTKTTAYLKEVAICKNHMIEQGLTHIKDVNLFRPPYGKISLTQAKGIREQGYKIIMWDVLSADFDRTISKEQCLQNVLQNAGQGSIVVFHDSLKASEKLQYVLPKVLEYFKEKGFSFEKLD
jgi:peptidoglycan/xylan/chitin deacetylase (PgdA/CDA1 family)